VEHNTCQHLQKLGREKGESPFTMLGGEEEI